MECFTLILRSVSLRTTLQLKHFIQLLKQDVLEQKLSLVTELSNSQKKRIVNCLLQGNIELLKYPKNQSNDQHPLMRKFAIILLRNITQKNNSLVKKLSLIY